MTTTTITGELQARIASLEAEVASLKERLEYAETVAAIKRGLEEDERGLGIPLRQVDEELRAKYKIPRT